MKIKRHLAAAMAGLLCLVLAMAGCSGSGDTKTIKIGTVPALYWAAWTATADYMEENDAETKVEMVPFKSSADVFVAMRSGEIDMASMGMNVMASGLVDNPDLPISMVAGLSPGRSQIIVRKGADISDWEDLRGKKLGIIRGSTDELIFNIALAQNDIDMDEDAEVTTLQASADLLLALRNGDIDASVTYQPYSAQAVSEGIADMPPEMNTEMTQWASVPSDIFASDTVIEENPEAVQEILNNFVAKTKTFSDHDVWVDTAMEYQTGEKALLLKALETDEPWWRMEQKTHQSMATAMAEHQTVSTDVSDSLLQKMNYDFLAEATGQTPEELGRASER